MKFDYIATDAQGKQVKGSVGADNTISAINILRGRGLFPLNVTEASGGQSLESGRIPIPGERRESFTFLKKFFRGTLSLKALTVFTRQLAVLIDAGLPILKCLHLLKEQEKNKALKETVLTLANAVESGSTFSEALERFPKIFTKLYVSMVRAGEAGGVLDEVLNRLAEFMEKSQRLKSRIKSAMIYPILVMVFAFGIVTFLITVIIPKFADIFLELDIDLPTLTTVMINISDFSKRRWYVFVLIVSLLITALRITNRRPKGKLKLDQLKLKMPIFGDIIRKISIARFSRTLGTLMTSGVPILKALMIVRDTIGNEVVSRAVTSVHDSIREGESIVDPLKQSEVFPPMVIGMIDVGEQTGNLAEMLVKIADTYDEEVDVTVQGLTSILEPLLIICLAFIVGFIVIAMFLPLIKLMQGLA
ncbi:MAG: type II secretion system inner membrane protein GspF [Chlamydiae bacterium]|nr:type II secretion system inner membrane protein GspF [Chlamydiota bacterium]MBI3266228.1 type II secretion system inner membrane protein GspF [Chlamydiota bacterium]